MNTLTQHALTLGAMSFLASWFMTRVLVHVAPRIGLIDRPNQRSSHSTPTPRAGGIAIVLAIVAAMAWWVPLSQHEKLALLPPALLIAGVGLIDDFRSVSPWLRLLVHVAAVAWAMYWLGGVPPTGVAWLDAMGWVRHLIVALGLVWFLNAFNFMDGIDGIAAGEALFVAVALAGLALLTSSDPAVPAFAAVIAGASLGFLMLNWSPARIFMGDVGSGTLGFLVGALGLLAWQRGVASPWVTAMLLSAFLGDATVTLVRRILRGDQWYSAHRTHAYQHLARRLRSHSLATLSFIGFNGLLIAPVAWMSHRGSLPLGAAMTWALLFGATCIAVFGLGAGRRE